ncbi:hypothetical protein OE749_00695 [Aestuariibacter sp. AA17]|uniref:PEP-CTERM protein-sorting domain-containing protein n=1 Tax=Fluctibacter corallii TaxID=2984329 RepID=A0ABT3A3F2_9ALTE|nr:hypothetical protein [Aestuariibacter sp. AA17]MCV2883210.1 hypothetical protein [Aestuariibacter sp. AA17]
MLKALAKSFPLLALFTVSASNAALLTSDFEDMSEGFAGTSFTNNGITYSEMAPFDNTYEEGVIDTFGSSVPNSNVLLMGGFGPTPGPSFSLNSFSTMTLTFSGLIANSIGLDVITGYNNLNTPALLLDVMFQGNVVGSTSLQFPSPAGFYRSDRLSFSGAQFDSVRLYSSDTNAYLGAAFDNVSVNIAEISEPLTFSLLSLGLAGIAFSRRKTS